MKLRVLLSALALVGCATHATSEETQVVAAAAAEPNYVDLTDQYFASVENLDFAAFSELMAPSIEFLVPYLPHQSVIGKEKVTTAFAGRFQATESVDVTYELAAISGRPQVLARAEFDFLFKNGVQYQNDGVLIFSFDEDGKISKIEEWVNPDNFRKAFAN